MNDPKPIDVEVAQDQPSQALAKRDTGGAVDRAMTLEELHANLEFIRSVMRREMQEGVDYGKIPGCGDKPTLLQPGAQKLLMTFNLCEQVSKEDVRDLPHPSVAGHREYAFTITVRSQNGKEWHGVGTCSTLEGKYRYRITNRRCPKCGKDTLLQSKKEPGFFCWAKKGGCGANYGVNDPQVTGQKIGKIEHENPADNWNTVRKMAFKRALVAAAINATNTSMLWTQDIEDMAGDAQEPPDLTQDAPQPKPIPIPSRPVPTPPAPAKAQSKPIPLPTPESRAKMIAALKAGPGEPNRDIVDEYFRKLTNPSALAPMEALEALPLRFVPATTKQMKDLAEQITRFGNGEQAEHAFRPHDMPLEEPKPAAEEPNFDAQEPTPGAQQPAAPAQQPALWWRDIIIPIPRKGEKRDQYMQNPDTIGSLYDLRHGHDDEAQAARQRLWWLAKSWQPAPREFRGKVYQPTEADLLCRRALDAFLEYFTKNHPDEKL